MTAPETLCNLHMIKAAYTRETDLHGPSGYAFALSLRIGTHEIKFDVPENDAELFAAELDVLAAIMHSRVIHARLVGQEAK